LSFNQGGSHEVAVENSEAIVVDVLFPLSNAESELINFYPNPCYEWLTVNNPAGVVTGISIFSMDGSLKICTEIGKGLSSLDLNLNDLGKGVYILELISDGKSLKQKLCKL
jgi:hypothetical protein